MLIFYVTRLFKDQPLRMQDKSEAKENKQSAGKTR